MIKLIVTDMDGTLLNEKGNLPDGFIETLNKLKEKNIKLIIASGRPYYTLQENFGPVSKQLSYICENGSLVVDNNKIIYKSVLDKDIVQDLILESKMDKDNALVLCTPNCAYIENYSEAYLKEIKKYYTSIKIVENLSTINDDLIKLSICNFNNPNNLSNSKLKDKLNIVSSADIWTDISNKGVNKGIGLKILMNTYNTSKDEIMVFGDFYNDIEMLSLAEYSFVMSNAPKDMKQYGNYIAESNSKNGVLKAIYEYAL